MSEKPLIKYGKDNNTVTINNNDRREEDWHDHRRGRLNVNGVMYYINLKNMNAEDWIAGKIVKMPDDKAKEWLEGTPAVTEKKTEQKVENNLDDEIPF